jgi:predicted nucleic acid-binding protein
VILIDPNILLYAYDSSSAHHEAARAWLETALSQPEPVGLELTKVESNRGRGEGVLSTAHGPRTNRMVAPEGNLSAARIFQSKAPKDGITWSIKPQTKENHQ